LPNKLNNYIYASFIQQKKKLFSLIKLTLFFCNVFKKNELKKGWIIYECDNISSGSHVKHERVVESSTIISCRKQTVSGMNKLAFLKFEANFLIQI
jgi:hypothetical protein